MNTTQGTAGLTNFTPEMLPDSHPLRRLGRRLADLLDADHWNNVEPLMMEIGALLSAKPAPVEAQGPTEIVLFDKTLKRFLGGGNAWGDGRPITDEARYWLRQGWDMAVSEDVRRLPKREPAPELAVADEGRFEALLEMYRNEVELYSRMWVIGDVAGINSSRADMQRREQALRAYFKASRSPVQEGAQGLRAFVDANAVWASDAAGMQVVTARKLYEFADTAPSQAIPEGRPMVDEALEYPLERAIRLAELWGAGKMIGGDEDAVIQALLKEVRRLQSALSTLGTGGSNG